MRRRAARADLISFTEYTSARYHAAAHHRLIATELQAVADGATPRLMINMPPRHGKSELASRRFPAWLLGRGGEQSIIAASYNMSKAEEFGGEVRDIVASAEYQTLFPAVGLKEDTTAKGFWRTRSGGAYIAAGVGTAITGRGTPGPIVIIDDPLKDREQADSELGRARVKSWYSSVILSRFPRGIIVIQTRWHEDDLSGWLLSEQERGGDVWKVLSLPAISMTGEALWPDMYPLEDLERIRKASYPRDWAALYQQAPAPDGGLYFQRDWLQYAETPPLNTLRIIGASDYAVTDGGGDYTVHVVAGLDSDRRLHLIDMYRRQDTSDAWVAAFIAMARAYKPVVWAEEEAMILKSVGPFLEREMRRERVWVHRRGFKPSADKPTRARTLQAMMGQGQVFCDPSKPWLAQMVAELSSFPAGKHDDIVDAMALLAIAAQESPPPSLRTNPRGGPPIALTAERLLG